MHLSAEHWQRFVSGDPVDVPGRAVILESWDRSRAAGVDPAPASPSLRRVPADELARRRAASASLLSAASAHLDWLSAALTDMPHVAYVVDQDGIVLHSVGNDPDAVREAGLLPGYDWSETWMGTNGAGTALASGQPVAVVGTEHYCRVWHGATCLASPVRGPDGAIVGAVDVSAPADRIESHRLGLVRHVAFAIERELARPVPGGSDASPTAYAELLRREQAARAEVEAASRAKDDFLAVLSHELRTPLTSMLGWTRLLRQGALDAATAARALESVERNIRLQTQLIEDLLDVSRITHGKLRLEVRAVDLAAVVRGAAEQVVPTARAKRIALDVGIDAEPAIVYGDERRLGQIASNLLSNAIKFTPTGGGIRIRLCRERAVYELTVSDTGSGINADFIRHVFDPFRQARPAAAAYGGLGIGLAIVRHLVELHGGTITATSAGLDRGSTFVVRLPAVIGTPAVTTPVSEAGESDEPVSLAGVRVLVVEDEPDSRDVVASVLDGRRAEVAVAASAIEALDTLAAFQPHVIVSDIRMPGMDGHAFVREVRRREVPGARVPAIALSAHAAPVEVRRALAAGFDLHLAKPVEPDRLVRTIALLLGRV